MQFTRRGLRGRAGARGTTSLDGRRPPALSPAGVRAGVRPVLLGPRRSVLPEAPRWWPDRRL